MRQLVRRLALGGILTCAFAVQASAQVTLLPSTPVRGRLEGSDARTPPNGSRHDLYQYYAQQGERVRIIMRSAAFDTFLAWGPMVNGRVSSWTARDDDGGGGTNSALEVVAATAGPHVIMATAYDSASVGEYTISVERLAAGATGAIVPGSVNDGCERQAQVTDIPALNALSEREARAWAECMATYAGQGIVLREVTPISTWRDQFTERVINPGAGNYQIIVVADRTVTRLMFGIDAQAKPPGDVYAVRGHVVLSKQSIGQGPHTIRFRADSPYTTEPVLILIFRSR